MTPEILQELCKAKMPFGKHKDQFLIDMPISYLEWFNRKGFPQNKLGSQLATVYEIKLNGLDHLLLPLRAAPKPEIIKKKVWKL
ncbi:DUF3820 family protein [Chryseobacterium sp. T1]